MNGGTHAERILDLLARRPGLDDDEIARELGIEPRQTVNQVCRRLAARGLITRGAGESGKIANSLCADVLATTLRPARVIEPASRSSPAKVPVGRSLVPADLARTPLIIPCSKAKRERPDSATGGGSIGHHLPAALAAEFSQARNRVRSFTPIDEATLVPAWQRYDGALYRAGREALGELMRAGCHVIILSGGYGAVLATEPIGMYNAALNPGWWQHRILERVLIAYAERHKLLSVRAFASATSTYKRVLQRVPWSEAGIDDAMLITPDAEPGGTLKSPASIGQAIRAMKAGNLTTGWKSSYGLGFAVHTS